MIAIGDLHGCKKTLEALLDKLPKDQEIVFVGDYVDRGPDSAGVIDIIKSGGYKCVLGNHEDMMLRVLKHEDANAWDAWQDFDLWIKNGGDKTLLSYGISEDYKMLKLADTNVKLQEHLEWMSQLPIYLEFPDVKNTNGQHLLVTHSSAHPAWKKKDSQEPNNQFIFRQGLLWGRSLNIQAIEGIYNVFGHTVHINNPRIKDCYANIDTGCCYVKYKKHGVLTALQFPEMIVYQQENLDMPIPEDRE
jgi:serine/threonine protein phosphatase 1